MTEANLFYTLRQIITGHILPRCLHVIAEFGVADALDETPRTAAELASKIGANPEALHRILTLLAANGIFEAHGNQFSHSPASRLLRSDHPQSMRAFARMNGSEINWTAYGIMEYTLRTGLSARDQVVPEGVWEYFAAHPDKGQIFNQAMAARAQAVVAGVIANYDFSAFDRIADIGGGLGHLLRAVLATTPNAKGVLFDLPHPIEKAKEIPSERVTFQAGDFFKDNLPVCDAYMLMDILHDWTDDNASEILKAVRRAAPPHAKVLVIEAVIVDNPGPHWSKTQDVHMMMLTGGRQRSRQQHERLFASAGFSLVRVIDLETGSSIVEAVPV